jgi:hypothetical protein
MMGKCMFKKSGRKLSFSKCSEGELSPSVRFRFGSSNALEMLPEEEHESNDRHSQEATENNESVI